MKEILIALFISCQLAICNGEILPCKKSVESKLCFFADNIHEYVKTISPEPIPTLINTTIIVNLCEVQLLPLNHLNVSLIHSVLKDRISIPSTNLFCNFFLFCTIYKRHICTIFLEHCVPQQKGQFDGRRVALIQIRRDT